jgi:hypothetical protein
MQQLSLLDLPADPTRDPDGPSCWWTVRYKPIYEQAVADFVQMYAVKPIFHLTRPKHQVFLIDPACVIIVDKMTGMLTKKGKRSLWEVDYRTAKAFRPQDVAPQIVEILTNSKSRETWRPLVMAEMRVSASRVEAFIVKLGSLDVFSQHWPAFQDGHMFRVFGEPDLLESLRYAEVSAGLPFAPLGQL